METKPTSKCGECKGDMTSDGKPFNQTVKILFLISSAG